MIKTTSLLRLLQIHLPPSTSHTSTSTTTASYFNLKYLKQQHPFPIPPVSGSSRLITTINISTTQNLIVHKESPRPRIEKPAVVILPPSDQWEWEETAQIIREPPNNNNNYSRIMIVGAASIGLALLFNLVDADEHKAALALGPQGPLVEEFWDNVRRYALYALTVSTGAIYTILQPILELLKNPISAILVLLIIGGTLYIVSQVLSAMVGVTDFTYTYG